MNSTDCETNNNISEAQGDIDVLSTTSWDLSFNAGNEFYRYSRR